MLRIADDCIQSWLYKAPATSVKRLLLSPDDFFHIWIFVQLVAELRPREGVQLLDANNNNIIDLVGFAVFDERSVNLTRTNQETGTFRWIFNRGSVLGLRNQPLEARVGEVGKLRASQRVAEQGLAKKYNQG